MSTTQDWSRFGGGLIVFLALGATLALFIPRFLGAAAGPELEIITALKETESSSLWLPVRGAPQPLKSQKHRFARITVNVAPGGQRAEAHATLDFEGTLGDTRVGTAGVERVPFVVRGGKWVPETTAAPRLQAVVTALESRRRALQAADAEGLERLAGPDTPGPGGPEWARLRQVRARAYQVEAWYVRLERDDAVVTEHWRLRGALPAKPVDTRGERRLLLSFSGDEFLFSPSLM
ncbi:hypothetical protein [Corallococcus macrosporus]|uniref:Uncharacterized protein n=1 Tax=Corallococcus macrosporus DSM 14697 TaxID=1189310 RepID=A0A250JTM0_9BACT|nr:hypothetical protein [Corallococcus macrosporus]ATB46456.1 hypothetical protein MYMAC_002054 [Corallococcus macrosporus DSM 14697]